MARSGDQYKFFSMMSQANQKLNFSLEDTTDKCYRDIINEFSLKGWNRVAYKKRSKLEKKRFPTRDLPHVIWTLNEKDIDFTDLTSDQVCNHFEGITSLTTKRGFSDLLADIRWDSEEADEISPRCYNLGDPIHREEFIDDFRIVAAINILKWYILHSQYNNHYCMECSKSLYQATAPIKMDHIPSSSSGCNNHSSRGNSMHYSRNNSISRSFSKRQKQPPPLPQCTSKLLDLYPITEIMKFIEFAAIACVWYIRVHKYGEWPEVDISRYFRGRETALEEQQWCGLLDFSYCLSELPCACTLAQLVSCSNLRYYGCGSSSSSTMGVSSNYYNISSLSNPATTKSDTTTTPSTTTPSTTTTAAAFHPYIYKLKTVLYTMTQLTPQYSADFSGQRNIWVVKAPESSCGIGIKVLSRLNDILLCEKGMGGRTVQKYVEFPLLTPVSTTNSLFFTKFDIRIWVLVTSFQPLQAYIYPITYGRRCSTAYSTSLTTLSDNFIHLTNYSIQKTQAFMPTNISLPDGLSGLEDVSGSPALPDAKVSKKLRNIVHNYRIKKDRNVSTTTTMNTNTATTTSNKQEKGKFAETDLLMDHKDIVNTVRNQYDAYLTAGTGTTAAAAVDTVSADSRSLAQEVLRRIGPIQHDVWSEYLWPQIRRKVLATLRAASREVVHREKAFEFLGYDVLISETLQPYILEANMSPAMAHRSSQQSALIARMATGLLDRAVYVHFPSAPITPPPQPQLSQSEDIQPILLDDQQSGSWELLTPPSTTATSMHHEAQEVDAKAQEDVVEAPAFIPLNDWDEMPPPPTAGGKNAAARLTTPTTSLYGSSSYKNTALQRKFSLLPPRNTNNNVYTSSTSNSSSSVMAEDAYYQKFIDAAANTSNTTSTSAAYSGAKMPLSGRNVSSMMVTGVSIGTAAIEQCDRLCGGFEKVLTLQSWWRKFAVRMRQYRFLLSTAAIKWWSRSTQEYAFYRHCNRTIISKCVVEKVKRKERMQLLAAEKVSQLTERKMMHREEVCVYEHNKYTEAVGFITTILEDLISTVYRNTADSFYAATSHQTHSPRNNKRKTKKSELTTMATTATTTGIMNSTTTATNSPGKGELRLSAEAETLGGFLSQQFTHARSSSHRPHIQTTATARSDYEKKKDATHITSAAAPKKVKFSAVEDSFQFTSQQLLEQAISGTEILHFHRLTEASKPATGTYTATTPINKVASAHQQHTVGGSTLFSPESQQLLDYMDSITFADVASQRQQSSLSSGSRLASHGHSHYVSYSNNSCDTPTSPRSQRSSRSKPIETKKSVSIKEYSNDSGYHTSRTIPTELLKHTNTSSEMHWQPQPQPPPTQRQQHASRVRPNVEYSGRFPVSTATSTSTVAPTTNLDEAIEEASLLNIQSILQRRPSDRSMPQDPRLTRAFSSDASSIAKLSAPYSVGGAADWDMQHTHTQVRIGHDTVHYAAAPPPHHQQQLSTDLHSQCYPHAPVGIQHEAPPLQHLRRSFDPSAATRPLERTVKNQNWFSYDEGSRKDIERNNEMWLLFLKQKRDAEAVATGLNTSSKVRPRSSDGMHRATRPYSIDQNKAFEASKGETAGEPHYRSPIIRPTPSSSSAQKEDWNLSLGRGSAIEGKPRPVSASGRLHTSGFTGNHANAPATTIRPSLNAALSSALYDTTTFSDEPCYDVSPQQQVLASSSERVKNSNRNHMKNKKTSFSRTGQHERERQKTKQHKQAVKERLTATYVDDKIIF